MSGMVCLFKKCVFAKICIYICLLYVCENVFECVWWIAVYHGLHNNGESIGAIQWDWLAAVSVLGALKVIGI